MRIGIPRALLYYRYGAFWQKFLAELGAEVVVSRATDKAIVQDGVTRVPSEICLPIKIVAGHLMELRDRVDAILLPRMMWLDDRLYACPKMIGIVDMARMMLGPQVRLIAPPIRAGLFWPHFQAGLQVTPNPARVLRAWTRSHHLLARQQSWPELPPGERRIALIGHFYNLGDAYISQAITETLDREGYRVLSKEDLPERVLRDRTARAGDIRWVFERELYNAFRALLGKVDGFCVVVSMGCGPDSLVAEFMRQEAADAGVPLLQLIFDEHTGTAGLVTRIEAFVELTRRRRNIAAAA